LGCAAGFLKEKASGKRGIVTPTGVGKMKVSMNFSHFLRIERDEDTGSKHYIVHTIEPRFSMEIAPDVDAEDRVGRGVIKRVCLPNSWVGDYGKYRKLINSAQEFFASTFADPVAKSVTNRLAR